MVKATSIMETKAEHELAPSLMDRLARRLVLGVLSGIQHGRLSVEEQGEVHLFGDVAADATPVAHISVQHPSAWRDILLRGSVGAGEAYMLGAWSSPDLTAVIRVLVLNMATLDSMDGRRGFGLRTAFVRAGKVALQWFHLARRNSRQGSRANISAHYDLGNEFFALFLDRRMMYSSAIFPSENASLEDASTAKLERICQRLQLSPSDHLLEIGTGWGGLAIYAARHYGCRVTTTTISREQFEYASARVAEQGLRDRVTVLLQDYRDLTGSYDKLVSVEMIEAVGHAYYRSYFQRCAALLKPDGLMLIQAITIADQRYEAARHSVDFIQRYIFPGGSLPSVEVISRHVARDTDLTIVALDDIGLHYARTLRAWHERFMARLDAVRAQGFDDIFIRMWQFYLCYCEGGFRERSIGTVQVLLAKPRCRLEPALGRL